MTKTLSQFLTFVLLLSTLLLQACGGGGDSGATAPTGLISGHQEVDNAFTLSVNSGSYTAGSQLDLNLSFPFAVDVTGSPQIELDLEGTLVQAIYTSGSGTENLTFRYIVQNGDLDLNGISIAGVVDLNGGSLQFTYNSEVQDCELDLNSLDLSSVIVDATTPTLSNFNKPADNLYVFGNQLIFSIDYSEDVVVTGTPRLELDIGGSTQYANYLSGSGTSTLVFSHTVTSADLDLNGIGVSSPVDLNGGSIGDQAGNVANNSFIPPSLSSVTVNGDLPVVISSVNPSDDTYLLSQELSFDLTFSEIVNVTGTPRLTLTLNSGTVYADYASGSGTDTLTFNYTVIITDIDNDGITLSPSIDLNGGSISDGSLNAAVLNFTANSTSNILVNGSIPTITSITPPADKTYVSDENLTFTVNYSESVNVTGVPSITVTIGSTDVEATYASGSGGANLVFNYQVQAGEADHDGIEITSPINLNGGSIESLSAINASLNFSAPDLTNVIVGSAPAASITSITPPTNNTYIETNDMDFTVNFDAVVNVTGTPRLQIDLATGGPVYADYLSGTGSSALVFRYTVEAGKEDLDGIALTSPLDLNSGTILDGSAVSADLTFTAPTTSSIFIDSLAPTITSVSVPSDGAYGAGTNLDFIINFNETVTLTGNDSYIDLTIGATSRQALCVATTSSTINCSYTVQAGEDDIDGIDHISIEISTSAFTDSAGNNADLSFTPASTAAVLVDTTAPLEPSSLALNTPATSPGNDSTPTIDVGGVISGDTVKLFTDATCTNEVASSVAAGTNILLTTSALTEATYNFYAKAIDAALNESTCSTATVQYDLDLTLPVVTLTSASDINASNETSYSVVGTCSENGRTVSVNIGGLSFTPNCSSGAFSITGADVSSLSDGTISITADHTDLAGNSATQATQNVNKDTATPTVTIITPPDITQANHTSYSVSGSCSENGRIVDVYIGAINIQPNCSSGTWSTGVMDVSSLTDGTIAITADHDNASAVPATQASVNVNKDSSAPTVTISSAPDITITNETTYIMSGTCSENGRIVDINIDAQIHSNLFFRNLVYWSG